MDTQERREYFRLHPHARVDVLLHPHTILPLDPGGATLRRGWIVNLSLGGMLIQLDALSVPLAEGDWYHARFRLPLIGPQELEVEVVHTLARADGTVGNGLRFMFRGTSRRCQEKILWQYLAEEQRQQKQWLLETRAQRAHLETKLQEVLEAHAAVKRAAALRRPSLALVVFGIGLSSVLGIYLASSVSPLVIILLVLALGLCAIPGSLWFMLQIQRRRLEHAQNTLQVRIDRLAAEYPEDFRSWGGMEALRDGTRAAELALERHLDEPSRVEMPRPTPRGRSEHPWNGAASKRRS